MQINLDIGRVHARDLALTDFRYILAAANRNLPAGSIEIDNQEVNIPRQSRGL